MDKESPTSPADRVVNTIQKLILTIERVSADRLDAERQDAQKTVSDDRALARESTERIALMVSGELQLIRAALEQAVADQKPRKATEHLWHGRLALLLLAAGTTIALWTLWSIGDGLRTSTQATNLTVLALSEARNALREAQRSNELAAAAALNSLADSMESSVRADRQLRLAGDGLNETRRQGNAGRRPIVLARPTGLRLVDEPNGLKRIGWNLTQLNYGPFPAISHVYAVQVVHGDAIDAQADAWFLQLPKRLSSDGTSILPPNPGPITASTTALSRDVVTEAEFKRDFGSDNRIAVIGRIEYSDGDTTYRTDFCFHRLASGGAPECQNHNRMSELAP